MPQFEPNCKNAQLNMRFWLQKTSSSYLRVCKVATNNKLMTKIKWLQIIQHIFLILIGWVCASYFLSLFSTINCAGQSVSHTCANNLELLQLLTRPRQLQNYSKNEREREAEGEGDRAKRPSQKSKMCASIFFHNCQRDDGKLLMKSLRDWQIRCNLRKLKLINE